VIRLSLNAHDRQALARIEETLADTDPRFAARLSAFARLADAGAMPGREELRQDSPHGGGSALRGLCSGQPAKARLMYWIAVALAVAGTLAVVFGVLVGGHAAAQRTCTGWQAVACGRKTPPSAPASPAHKGGLRQFLEP
jgi:hypothetical protein